MLTSWNRPALAGPWDGPSSRIAWTLPTAALLLLLAMWIYGHFVRGLPVTVPTPRPIEAEFVQLPASPLPSRPTPAPAQEPEPVSDAKVPDQTIDKDETPTPAEPAPVPPPRPSKPVVAHPKITKPAIQSRPQQNPDTASPPATNAAPPAPEAPANPGSNATGKGGARALSKPMPKIPDDLRQEAMSAQALARFTVRPDGTDSVELVKATPNVRLNQLLLDTLKNWRFFPAMKEGKPTTSTEDILIKIEIK